MLRTRQDWCPALRGTTDHMGSGKRTRVLVVYGSEGGTAKRTVAKMVQQWAATPGCDFEICATMTGNEVPELNSLSHSYDALIIGTSSFGEGDPPGNYNLFLVQLLKAMEAGDKPLAGMQHAVLGFGASVAPHLHPHEQRVAPPLSGAHSRRTARESCSRHQQSGDSSSAAVGEC